MPDLLTAVSNVIFRHLDSERISLKASRCVPPFPAQKLTKPELDLYYEDPQEACLTVLPDTNSPQVSVSKMHGQIRKEGCCNRAWGLDVMAWQGVKGYFAQQWAEDTR